VGLATEEGTVMSKADIMVVEDDPTISRFLELELRHAGYDVRRTTDGNEALEMVGSDRPDLMILDLMLPGLDGIEVARRVRSDGCEFPILVLTARVETQDVVEGFEAGADDYLRKPFEIPELMSRVNALLKRVQPKDADVFSASGVSVDTAKRIGHLDGEQLNLTAKEFDLLAYLVKNAGRVVSRDEILAEVWRGQHATDSNVIEVFVCHLRNKIDDRENLIIQTIRGVGYFFAKG
jgi:two-component system alkaline phosphatase synthesis response regulator PhoP